MIYEDFNLNEKSMEKIAKQFEETKIMQNNEEEEVDKTQNLIYDVFSAFKILERLIFTVKNQTRNQNLINFIYDSQNLIDQAYQELLKISNDVVVSDIDFEMPQSDAQTSKLIQNILSSIIIEVSQMLISNDFIENKRNIIIAIAEVLKNSLNIEKTK